MHNQLLKFTYTFDLTEDIKDIELQILKTIPFDSIYCFIMYKTDKYYKLDIHISVNAKYNTLTVKGHLIDALEKGIVNTKRKDIIAYKQPNLDILCEVMQPLVYNLAIQQHNHWNKLSLDDLVQMCYEDLISLYRKGFYVHKKLLKRTFINNVLKSVSDRTVVVSFEEPINDEGLKIEDMLEDASLLNDLINAEGDEEEMIKQYKIKLVKSFMSERQWQQLCREYGSRTVSPYSAGLVNRLKQKIKKLNLNLDKILEDIFEDGSQQ